jgi:hypothetical protein
MRLLRNLAIGLGIAVVLVGCGSNDSDGSGEPLSKSEYQQALVRLYIDAQQVGDLYPGLEDQNLSQSECVETARAYTELVSSLIERLADLEPPPGARQPHAELVAGGRTTVGRWERLVDRIETGKLSCGRTLGRLIIAAESDSAEAAFHRLQELGYATFD